MKYFGKIAEIVGKDEETLNADSSTLDGLLAYINDCYPGVNSNLFATFINSRKAMDLSQTISENDEIYLMPPFAGG